MNTANATPLRVYRILREAEWRHMQASGIFVGTEVDRRDGFIHLSLREQLEGTVERHFAGERDLVALEIDANRLSDLRWEPSRDGLVFPHLYGSLPLSAVVEVSRVQRV